MCLNDRLASEVRSNPLPTNSTIRRRSTRTGRSTNSQDEEEKQEEKQDRNGTRKERRIDPVRHDYETD